MSDSNEAKSCWDPLWILSWKVSLKKHLRLFVLVYECFVCMSICVPCLPGVKKRSEEGITSPGNGVTGGCEMNCWCWELNLDPLQEQLVLLTPKQSLQPPGSFFKLRNGPWGENYCLPWNTGGCTVLFLHWCCFWVVSTSNMVTNEHALPCRWSWSEGLWSTWGWALKFYSLDPLLFLSLFPDYRGIHTYTHHTYTQVTPHTHPFLKCWDLNPETLVC